MSRLFASASSMRAENAAAAIAAFPLTMACWFKPTTSTATQTALSLGHSTTADRYIALGIVTANTSFFELANGTGTTDAFGPAGTIADGAWGHLAGVAASATSRIAYTNGVAGTADTASKAIPAGMNRTTVGAFQNGASAASFSNAAIAEVAFWNVALNATEIAALARGVNPRMIRPAALVFYAPLWGTSSPERDYTVGQRHLTLVNTPTVAAHAPVAPPPPFSAEWQPYVISAAGTPWTQPVDDAATITDAVALAQGFGLTAPDAAAITDAIAPAATTARTVADSAAITDLAALGRGSVLADAASISDSAAAGLARLVNADDGATITDLASLANGRAIALSDTATITDLAASLAAFTRTQGDVAALTDARALSLGELLSDAATIVDATTALQVAARVLADAAQVTDLATTSGSGGLNLADVAAITDASTRSGALLRVLADAVDVTDARTFASTFVRLFADDAQISDALAPTQGRLVVVSDAAQIVDGVLALGGRVIDLGDVALVSDEIATELELAPIGRVLAIELHDSAFVFVIVAADAGSILFDEDAGDVVTGARSLVKIGLASEAITDTIEKELP